MANDQTQLIETLSEALGAALATMVKEVENFSKKGKEAAGQGGGLQQLDTLFQGMTRNLVGPVGLAAALYAVGKSLENLSVGRLQLQNFSKDTGASIPLINGMTEALKKAGITAEEGQQSIARLGQLVQGLAAKGFGSELGQLLLETGRSANEIQKLIDTAKTNTDKAMLDTVDILRRGNAQYQHYTSQQSGLRQSHLQAMQNTQGEMNKVYVSDIEAAKKWHEDWTVVARGMSNTWDRLRDKILRSYAALPQPKIIVDELNKRAADGKGGFDPDPKSIVGRMAPGGDGFGSYDDLGSKAPDWLQRILHPSKNKQWPFFGSSSIMDILKNSGADFSSAGGDSTSFDDRFTGGGAAPWAGKDLLDIETDSNKLLRDIRDAITDPLSGGAGSDVESLGGRQRLAARLGMRTSSGPGGETPGGLGGRGGKIDMKGGEKSETGMYYPGTSTSLGGVVGSDSASRGRGGHQGDDFMMPHGSNLYATKDGVVESYGVDNFGGKTMRIRHADGSTTSYLHMSERELPIGAKVSGGQVIGKSGTANTVPHLHLEMRNPKGQLVEPSIALGVRKKQAEAAAPSGSVTGSWFNDRQTASGADASQVAGIALPSRSGLGKMHEVTLPDGRTVQLPQIDVGPAKWTGRGIDFSKPAAAQLGFDPTDKAFTYRRVGDGNTEAAREAIDKSQSLSSRIDASMSAIIDFQNMPSWVKSSVDDNGKFKNLRITRSTPQGGKASSPQGDLQNWSYE